MAERTPPVAAAPDQREHPTSTRGLALVWFGQLVSLVGSSLTGFVLGVWVFQQTGSATKFALIMFAGVLPAVLLSPVTGVLADRVDRRRLMLLADLGGGAVTAVLALLLYADALEVWHVYVTTGLGAIFVTVHAVAFNTLLPALVPARHLGRANGLMQILQAAQIAAPVLAASLLAIVGLRGIVLIDLGTMIVGVALLLLARLPSALTAPPVTGREITLRADLAHGWRYLSSHRPLRRLVLVFAAFNFLFATAGVLIQPLILSFTSVEVLGVLMLLGGSGVFAGSLLMAAWGGPVPRVRGIAIFLALGGLALAAHAARPSALLIAMAAPAFLLTLPILNGSAMTIVQTVTDPASLGRVIATVRMCALGAAPVAYLLAGPLSDRLAEPAFAPGGELSTSLGRVIGTGPGRGSAAIFLGLGVGMILLALLVRSSRELATLDAAPDARATTAEGADPCPSP